MIKKAAALSFLILWSHLLIAQCEKIFSFETDQFGGPSTSLQLNGKLIFSAYDATHGRELWCTDGTTQGTFMLKDIWPGNGSGIADYFDYTAIVHNNMVYFRGNDSLHGVELWRTDGTPQGTYMVADLVNGTAGSAPGDFASVDSLLYFIGNTGTSLYRSDGTAQGTYSFAGFQIVRGLTGFNGKLYFSAGVNNTGEELWRSNGTPGGTYLLKDLNGVLGASLPCNFHATTNALYFMANTSSGWELWKTDGSNSGTVLVADINPGPDNGVLDFYSVAAMNSLGDTLYFAAKNDSMGYQLWRSDGTPSGTQRLSNVANGILQSNTFPVSGGNVMFASFYASKFYSYNIALDSTYLSEYPFYYYFHSSANKYLFSGSRLFFAGKDTLFGPEMWQSDGSLGGERKIQETHLVNNWSPNTVQGFNVILGAIGSKLLFYQARNPFDAEKPLFVLDTAIVQTCHPPSVIVNVPVSSSSTHVLWNHVNDQSGYQIRFKKPADILWTIDSTDKSYFAVNNLDTVSDYMFQLRTACSGIWSDWSDTVLYNTGFIGNNSYANMLAEKAEDSTTVRLYWLRSSQISQVQFRYRPYGSTNWNYTTNASGHKRITGLTPSTFYEYTYREDYNGTWAPWYFGSFYFNTPGNLSTSLPDLSLGAKRLMVYPNPTSSVLYLEEKGALPRQFRIFDLNGRLVHSGFITGNSIDVSALQEGGYLLSVTTPNGQSGSYFVKE
ncbi:MAG: T9SS type A sorting domain-containing protein [Bacteroidetes bacterium]|nr:T9SS type A sorting domain-containing protein [Bacteroidota bacterium]